MFLITAGTVLIAVVVLLNALFPYSATLNSDGELVAETEGLVSANVQILTSAKRGKGRKANFILFVSGPAE